MRSFIRYNRGDIPGASDRVLIFKLAKTAQTQSEAFWLLIALKSINHYFRNNTNRPAISASTPLTSSS